MKQVITRRRHLVALLGAIATPLAFYNRAHAADKRLLVTCIDSDPPTMNAAISSAIQALQTSAPVYNWLLHCDNTGKENPELAAAWSVSDDGKDFKFRLHENVKWHDGQRFTSEDVKFTVERMLSKLQPIGKNAYKDLIAVEAPSEFDVTLRFSRPNVSLLSLPFALGPILPRHLWEGTNFADNPHDKAPIGTGPFQFKNYDIGDKLEYVRNEAYFDGVPKFDGLIIRILPDAVARSAAFENGDLDCIIGNSVPFTDIPRLRKLPDVNLKVTNVPGAAFLAVLNVRSGPLSHKAVRQALAQAIDRKFIRENIVPGIGHNMIGPVAPSSPLYNKSLKDYAFDAAAANKILDASGLQRNANGVRFDLRLMWQNVFPVVTRMADVITENLKAIGIRVVATSLEWQTLVQRGCVDAQFDMMISSYALGPDPDFGVERLYRSDNILPLPFTNNSGYSNATVDRLLGEQKQATNQDARKVLYDKIQEAIWEDVPILPICAYDLVGFENKTSVSGVYDGWNVLQENFAKANPRG